MSHKLPEQEKKIVKGISLKRATWEELKRRADAEGITLSLYVQRILKEHLNN